MESLTQSHYVSYINFSHNPTMPDPLPSDRSDCRPPSCELLIMLNDSVVPAQLSTYPLPLGGYYEDQGTSMSCPALVGCAALLLQARPGQAPLSA